MRTLLTSVVVSTISMLGPALAREAVFSPLLSPHEAGIAAERRVAQFASTGPGGVPCMTEYILTPDKKGWYLRKAVDCVE